MHPLFLSHLIGDFLLQPGWLVKWKQKDIAGTILHALIHGIIMMALVVPVTSSAFLAILGITLSHAAIDQIKINSQSWAKTFAVGFLIDQCAHFAIIAVAAYSVQMVHPFWYTEMGRGIGALLFFFAASLAYRNLFQLAKYPVKSRKESLLRFALITAPFILFGIPALALGASACF